MVMANVGQIEWEGKTYTLQDVLGGGVASLDRDPVLAMRIIGQAVDDVTTLRGRLGAFQANMLQTNQNSLEVALEMLTTTESAIRDTNMAEESTEFTKNQVLLQAGTAMLAQANQINKNILQLLG
jgi:flagellin